MKFSITFKDPDGVSDSIAQALIDEMPQILDDEEREAASEVRRHTIEKFIGKWIEYTEYVTIDFDTEAGTAVVRKKS